MKTSDIFKINRSSRRINESLEKIFGQKINLENFDLHQLQDARNKLRTQISQVRSQSGFNETIENEALTKAQWMLDAINAEVAQREEFIIDSIEEGSSSEAEMILHNMAQNGDFDEIYDAMGWYLDKNKSPAEQEVGEILQDMANDISAETGVRGDEHDFEKMINMIADRLEREYGEGDIDDTPDTYPDDDMDGDHDSVQEDFGSLEEKVAEILEKFEDDAKEVGAYGNVDVDAIVSLIAQGDYQGAADEVYGSYTDKDGDEPRGLEPYIDDLQVEFEALGDIDDTPDTYPDDDMDGDHDSAMASAGFGSDEDYGHYGEDQQNEYFYFDAKPKKDRGPRDTGSDELERRSKLGKNPLIKHGKEYKEKDKYGDGYKIGGPKGKLPEDQEVEEKAPPGAKAERMVKHIKKGYAKDGKLTDKERSIAYATAWKAKNKSNESVQGDNMRKLTEGEIQQAQSIVTAKTMVDRVGRWIEELSGMENDTLLQLGDQIRDEMGSEQAKNFISAVAPAIQTALDNLKQTRETLATGVRTLTGEEQGAEMLGVEPEADIGGEEDLGAAEPDMMNMPTEEPGAPEDEFAAAEPAAGGAEAAGREKRESIQFENRLLKVLAG